MTTTAGNIGVSFAALSYAGSLTVVAMTDPDVVPERALGSLDGGPQRGDDGGAPVVSGAAWPATASRGSNSPFGEPFSSSSCWASQFLARPSFCRSISSSPG